MRNSDWSSREVSDHLCECGCGERTLRVKKTRTCAGHIAGQPLRFVHGHYPRSKTCAEYRRTTVNGKMRMIHRLRAERTLGKPLPPKAVVHHADGSRSELAPLVICQDDGYHALLHLRMRVKKAGGDPNTQALCSQCRRPKEFAAFSKSRRLTYGISKNCKACHCKYQRAWRRRSASGREASL